MSNLLEKASIITTPTAYSDGVLHSVKPEQTLGSELVINGDFATDSDWNKGIGWSISNNTAISDGSNTSGSIISQSIQLVEGKTYQVIVDVDSVDSGRVRFYSNILGSGGQADITSSGTFTYNVKAIDTGNKNVGIQARDAGTQSVINSISVKELINADFTFTRNDAGTRVNSSGNIESVGVDLPRIDYRGGSGSLLLEPDSTNLFLNSETLSTQDVTTTSSTYTVSFYGIGSITFTGTHVGVLSGTGLNDRVTTTLTSTSGTLTCTVVGSVKFAQFEEQSYPTSYIPTSGSPQTRAADSATDAGSSDLINSTEGVLYAEISALANDGTIRYFGLNDGSSNNRALFLFDSTANRVRAIVSSGGTKYVDFYYDVTDLTEFHKIALVFKENDFSLWVDGTERNTDTSGLTPIGLDRFEFQLSGGGNFYGKVKCVAVFKEALTDAELTCLTTPNISRIFNDRVLWDGGIIESLECVTL